MLCGTFNQVMESFLDLEAAQSALELVEEIYVLCTKLPKEELYGLSSQLKNASTSIVANIAEGFGRYTYKDKASRYVIARGECTEVVAHLVVAVRVKMLSQEDTARAHALADKTGRLLSGLISSSRARQRKGERPKYSIPQYSNHP